MHLFILEGVVSEFFSLILKHFFLAYMMYLLTYNRSDVVAVYVTDS